MTPEELAELRKHAERDDFTDGYQADGRGELKPAKTPYYMILLPSNFRAALAAAQQEARAAALEEAARIADAAPSERWSSLTIASRIRALLEGK